MKTSLPIYLLVLAFISSFILLPSAFPQGSLTPPGSPAPLFKTLEQIEPRIDLQNAPAAAVTTSDEGYHFIITQPGSYYLSANLGVTKTNGIQINAEGVTLDLNGFEISRASGIGVNGIEIAQTSHRASVRNGSIKGFAYGVNSTFLTGYAKGCAFRDLAVSGCTSSGILAGAGAVLESCRAHDNSGSYGIFAGAGATLSNCLAHKNTATFGIDAGSGSTLSNCSASSNTSAAASSGGIFTGFGCTISHCSAYANTSTAATSTPSTGMGFAVGSSSTIQNCTAYLNEGDGITLNSNSVARDNTCDGNGNGGDGAGIHATASDNRIEANNVTGNDRGIDVDVAGNFIVKNTASRNTTDYAITGTQTIGPIITATGTIATTNPWANFEF